MTDAIAMLLGLAWAVLADAGGLATSDGRGAAAIATGCVGVAFGPVLADAVPVVGAFATGFAMFGDADLAVSVGAGFAAGGTALGMGFAGASAASFAGGGTGATGTNAADVSADDVPGSACGVAASTGS
jgi:hypothetical protein